MGNFKEDIARVRAFVFDVDGVFTDGGIIVNPQGDFVRLYNSKDGFAVAHALRKGYKFCIITGGRGECLSIRFKMLGITDIHLNCTEKLAALRGYLEREALEADEVMYMGDDIPDIEPMIHVGMPVCPQDAASEVVGISRYVSQFPGGRGCVRDVIEQVLRSRGDWVSSGEHVTIASR